MDIIYSVQALWFSSIQILQHFVLHDLMHEKCSINKVYYYCYNSENICLELATGVYYEPALNLLVNFLFLGIILFHLPPDVNHRIIFFPKHTNNATLTTMVVQTQNLCWSDCAVSGAYLTNKSYHYVAHISL